MKIHAFDDLYPQQLATGSTSLYVSDGSNAGVSGGDVIGESGDLSVVRLSSTVSLGSNLATGALLGDVLTIIQASPPVARFATPSNSAPGAATVSSNIARVAITAVFDGAGSAISAGSAVDLYIPFDATILSATSLADQSTSSVVAVWNDAYGNYPPTIADAITGANPPTITAAAKAQDSTLSGWTTSVSSNSTLRFSVASNNTATRLTVALTAYRSTA